MKISKQLIGSFLLLIVVASLYRIMPGRPYGFAPQIAMAIFGGAIVRDKKLAFILPLLSMLVSDGLYQLLYINGVGNIFIISNFLVWASASPLAGLARPKTFSGLMMCYADGLPFYPWSVAATVVFSAVLFGSYYFIARREAEASLLEK